MRKGDGVFVCGTLLCMGKLHKFNTNEIWKSQRALFKDHEVHQDYTRTFLSTAVSFDIGYKRLYNHVLCSHLEVSISKCPAECKQPSHTPCATFKLWVVHRGCSESEHNTETKTAEVV